MLLQDRVTSDKWQLASDDGQLLWYADTGIAESDPVIHDRSSGLNYKIFISDGQLGLEPTSDACAGDVQLADVAGGVAWILQLINGELSVRPGALLRIRVLVSPNVQYNEIDLQSYISKQITLYSLIHAA